MAGYIAMRIMDQPTDEAGRAYYTAIFNIPLYQQFKADVNAILLAQGYGARIPQ